MELNKIHHGNCFDYFKRCEAKSVDHVFTSPPYNRKRNDKYELYDDTIADYFEFLTTVVEECRRIARKYVLLNIMPNYYNKADVYALIGRYSDQIQQIIIWEKTNPLPRGGSALTNAYEMILVFGDSSLKSNSTYTKNIIRTPVNGKMPKHHKAVMHPDVADWFIEKFTQENEIIMDPFMGTGTTALSCVKYNRNFIGIELVQEYVEYATQRIEEAKSEPQQLTIEEVQ